MYWHNLKAEEIEIPGIGKAIVSVDWTHDDTPVEGSVDFGDEEEERKYLRKFETGKLMNLGVRVVVRSACIPEIVGQDSLWGNHVHCAAELAEVVAYHSMVEEATAALIRRWEDVERAILSMRGGSK